MGRLYTDPLNSLFPVNSNDKTCGTQCTMRLIRLAFRINRRRSSHEELSQGTESARDGGHRCSVPSSAHPQCSLVVRGVIHDFFASSFEGEKDGSLMWAPGPGRRMAGEERSYHNRVS